VQTATNETTSTLSNGVGFFLFPALRVGSYEITVETPGMASWQGTVNLIEGQTAELTPQLKPAGTATEVTVAGNVTPLVTTTAPTLATVVERQRIDQLPLNGRNVTSLIYMTTPGVESDSLPRVYGLRYASEVVQDGALYENRYCATTPDRQPGLDTIDEFRVETNNSSAKLNRPGTVILTTRSGTNEVHGTVFETARNSAIGVARARTDYYTKPPHLARNEFGASVGGPVYLPKLYSGKNKSFFFFSPTKATGCARASPGRLPSRRRQCGTAISATPTIGWAISCRFTIRTARRAPPRTGRACHSPTTRFRFPWSLR
jgi:Carboxypeptidase regulatory-like domain